MYDRTKKAKMRNVGGSVQKTASTLFSSDWDGKPHGVGYLATDMNQENQQQSGDVIK